MNKKIPYASKSGETLSANAVTYEESMQLLVDKLLVTDYDFLGLINAATGYLMVFGKNIDLNGMAQNGSSYDEEMPRIFKELLPEAYYEEGVRTMERLHVIRALEHHDTYVCSFPARAFGGIKEGQKQWKFSYLDSSRTQIWLTRTDITDVYTAERDALTGLYNRQGFYQHAREILNANPEKRFVVLRCDIDRFKAFNDSFGMAAGDKILAEFGRAVRRKTWAKQAIFARLEADHFGALYPLDELDVKAWEDMHTSWLSRISSGYKLTSSVGIYEITDSGIDISFMCDRALLALRTVKDNYTKKVAWYDENLRRKLMEEQAMVDDMEAAIEQEQFVVYLQPQINYATSELVGAEALVRWHHPKFGLILPGEFIPIFEKNGFILKLDTYVWEKSCQYLHRRRMQNPEEELIPISVNISRYDVYDSTLCDTLCRLIEKYELSPELLRLEITETAYMENPEQLVGVIEELHGLGFTVEMDDFGAGYSSLNTLKDVPVDVLKLDIRFLSGGKDNVRGGQILYSVIRMAHWLKLPVIAEGVETVSQADYLKSLSCVYMQGYHFARPMPEEEFNSYVSKIKTGNLKMGSGKNDFGANALWDPATWESVLFNRFASGVAILEYWDGKAEIIRANDLFYSELETTREAYMDKQRHTFDRFSDKNRGVYMSMLDQAIRTGSVAECEVESLPQQEGGKPFWTYNRVRLLTDFGDHALLCLAVENITERKQLLERLENLTHTEDGVFQDMRRSDTISNQELRIMEKQSGRMVSRYYIKTHILERLYDSSEERYGGSVIQENIPDFSIENKTVSPDTAQAYRNFFHQMCAGVAEGSVDIKILTEKMGYRWHHGNYSLVYAENGAPVYALIIMYDDTEERERKLAAEKWRANLSLVLAEAMLYAEINLRANTVERLEQQTDEGEKKTGIETFEEVVRLKLSENMKEEVRKEYEAFFDRYRLMGLFAEGVTEDHFDYCLPGEDDADIWTRASVRMTKHPCDDEVIAAISFTSLSDQEKELERLSQKVCQDALTGILNREGLEQKVAEILKEVNPENCTALMMLDLDNFKLVNDHLGHQMGDTVLCQVADVLKRLFRRTDVVGRIGGDEFIVFISGDFSDDFLEKKAEELLESMKMNIGEQEQIAVSISIGIAYGWAKTSFEKLYRVADIALYSSKRAGKCCYNMINEDANAEQVFFDSDTIVKKSAF